MISLSTDSILAFAAGLLIAVMVNANSLLAKHTAPVFASWAAHGIGAAAALLLVAIFSSSLGESKKTRASGEKTPFWFYLGGIPGALTVILAAVTVNSSLALSGTIALMLLGQVLFGLLSDHFGLLGVAKRRVAARDFLVAFAILAGSSLIIFGRSQP